MAGVAAVTIASVWHGGSRIAAGSGSPATRPRDHEGLRRARQECRAGDRSRAGAGRLSRSGLKTLPVYSVLEEVTRVPDGAWPVCRSTAKRFQLSGFADSAPVLGCSTPQSFFAEVAFIAPYCQVSARERGPFQHHPERLGGRAKESRGVHEKSGWPEAGYNRGRDPAQGCLERPVPTQVQLTGLLGSARRRWWYRSSTFSRISR